MPDPTEFTERELQLLEAVRQILDMPAPDGYAADPLRYEPSPLDKLPEILDEIENIGGPE
jgi:hypothetical protein